MEIKMNKDFLLRHLADVNFCNIEEKFDDILYMEEDQSEPDDYLMEEEIHHVV